MKAALGLLKRNANYRWLCLAQFIALFGMMFTSVALPYQIYHLTHSVMMIGVLSLFQLVPLLFTALLGGALADRYHRQRLLLGSGTLLTLCSLALALNSLLAHPSIVVIFIAAIFASALNGLYRPAASGIIQTIVKKEDFIHVGILSNIIYSLGSIVGPAIGGLIIAHFGVEMNFFIDFGCFSIAMILVALLKSIPQAPRVETTDSVWASLKEGLRYAKSRQELMGTYLVDFVAMIFGMPNALFPAIAVAYGGAKTLGLLYTAPAVGALLISCVSGPFKHVRRHGLAIAIAAGLWGLAIMGFGLAKPLWLMLLFLALAGAADAVSGLFRSMMWNDLVPNQLRSRLAGIEMISYLSGPKLGDTESGLVAAAFGITFSIVSGGALCLVAVGLSCYFLPRYYRYRSHPLPEGT
jgi:MFS family permease